MIRLPFKTPYRPLVTQEYGVVTNISWYKANGINIPFHNGTDFVFGSSRQTYGVECICPFQKATVVRIVWDNPTSTKGNGVTIQTTIENKLYQVVFWHTGEVAVSLGQELKLGDIICYVGNSGLCKPSPTQDDPWAGAHLHLMLFEYTFNGLNWNLEMSNNGVGGAIDPRNLFDFYSWTTGADTGMGHDQWVVLQWLNGLSGWDLVKYLRDKIKFW